MDNLKCLEAIRKLRVPVTCTIEITNRCHFACPYCYLDNKSKELSKERIVQLIDEAISLGCVDLTLTGGDAFIHPDFDFIYMHAYEKGLKITIFTNAYSIKESTYEVLRKCPPHKIECTLYGSSEEGYYKVTQCKGAYETVKNNLNRLRALGVNVYLKAFFSIINYADRFLIAEEIKKWNDGNLQYDYNILPKRKYDWSKAKEYQLSNKDIVRLQCDLNANIIEEWQERLNTPRKECCNIFECGAGNYSYIILVNEDMQICHFAYFSAISLKNRTIKSVWNEFEKYSKMKITDDECINKCELNKFCAKCPVQCFLHNNLEENGIVLEGKVEKYCDLAKEQYAKCVQMTE